MRYTRIVDEQINSKIMQEVEEARGNQSSLSDRLQSLEFTGAGGAPYYSQVISLVRKGKDRHGIFTLLEWRREDNTLYKTSQLTGGSPPQYSARIEKYYDTDGETVLQEMTFTLAYSEDGELVSEVLADA